MKTTFLYLATILWASNSLWAHPTSSQGTISLMGDNSSDMSHYDVSYSYRYWLSLGARYHEQRQSQGDTESLLGTLGLLLYRSNGESHQGNVYLMAGAGRSFFKDLNNKTLNDEFSYSHGLQADYETRKIYTLAKYENLRSKDKVISEYYQLRLGFAPYVAGFYDLNSWFILQASQDRVMGSHIEIAPLIRFFYKNVLTELGSTIDGKFIFNFMVHY
jgi:hypothetical protein